MNKLLSMTVATMVAAFSFGQVQVPQLSPEAEIEQVIGLTEVEVEYSRPSVRGREIFGGLLPYDAMWRTGANKNTTISFSTDVTIKESKIKEGEYALFTKPGKEEWTIYLYQDADNWGMPDEWDESKVVASFNLPVLEMPNKTETFTIQFEKVTTTDALMTLSWENVKVAFSIHVPTKELTIASIEKTMAGDSITERDYYGAASYYLESGEQLSDALKFIEKAIKLRGEEAFWYIRKKALIEYELGMKKAAIKTAKRSLESAEKAGNSDYVRMNEESILKWESEEK